jgi:hypothetical protein
MIGKGGREERGRRREWGCQKGKRHAGKEEIDD